MAIKIRRSTSRGRSQTNVRKVASHFLGGRSRSQSRPGQAQADRVANFMARLGKESR